MDDEILKYLGSLSNVLNGQIRGAINKKAREENLELINMTLTSVFENGAMFGRALEKDKEALDKFKKDLGIPISPQLKIPFKE